MSSRAVPSALTEALARQPMLAFAVLVGSRATGQAHEQSDWDIALQWSPRMDEWTAMGAVECLRSELARALQVEASQVDLIDLRRANLAMKASAAEEGVLLTAPDAMAWEHFLQRTWRELEDHYWAQQHAA
ncbi:MAG: hypothetical protein KGZ67_15545 [Hydrogenophaga sp.]|nr:hypothetical protein [Hydrogenophaga sp.]